MYPYFIPLRAIFSDEEIPIAEVQAAKISDNTKGSTSTSSSSDSNPEVKYYNKIFEGLTGAHAIVIAGKLVRGSASPIDILIIG